MDKLKPCPFCGGGYFKYPPDFISEEYTGINHDKNCFFAITDAYFLTDAMGANHQKAWNRRAKEVGK
jgi:hypothetical protein